MDESLRFRPKLFEVLKGYSAVDFKADVIAGVTVGIIALPLAMAFAIASGAPPQAGIFTAVIGGFLISALGGTRVCIGGPTGAFIVILAGINAQHGMENLAVCTIMAGLMLLAMGIARLGAIIKFIPFPVTMGFTSGIAVLIFSTQIKDFLGLAMERVPSHFLEKLGAIAGHMGSINVTASLLAACSLAAILFWPKRWQRRLPGSIIALVVGTFLAVAFHLPVETIGSKFGGIPQGLPAFALPSVSLDTLRTLFQPALTIALLAAIESLLCAVVADGMIDDRHDSNQELMAQGLANIASPLFGGIAATGAIARTASNIKNGARTPVAGIVHSLVLLAVILVAAPLAHHIPLAILSAILVNVAINMGEWHNFARLSRWPRSDALVFLASFFLTVLVDLTVAVEVGMVLAAILFIKRAAETTHITPMDGTSMPDNSDDSLSGRQIPPGVMVYRIFGTFFFGAADKLERALRGSKGQPEVLILRMNTVMAMDATGLNALEDLRERLEAKGSHVILSGPHAQPLFAMEKAGFLDDLGRENVCATLDESLERAKSLLARRAG